MSCFYKVLLWTIVITSTTVLASTSQRLSKRSIATTTSTTTTLSSSGYNVLGDALHSLFYPSISSSKLTSILKSLAGAQSTFKRLDGISHELYQRTHSTSSYNDDNAQSTLGRASRSASRTGSCADALFGCELSSWIHEYYLSNMIESKEDNTSEQWWNSTMGTLQEGGGRQILFTTSFNHTISWKDKDSSEELGGTRKIIRHLDIPISIVVLYEPFYNGGCGLHHGGINALLEEQPQRGQGNSLTDKGTSTTLAKGRILVILQDGLEGNLEKTLQVLNVPPELIDLEVGLISQELACVNNHLWKCAALILSKIEPSIQRLSQSITKSKNIPNSTMSPSSTPFAFHFVGRSLAGGMAALAAAMMDGCIPIPPIKSSATTRDTANKGIKKSNNKKSIHPNKSNKKSFRVQKKNEEMMMTTTTMHAYGQGCTSAITLGSPPCLSSNVKAAFVTSIIYGDDIISRCTSASLDRLKQRIDRCLSGGFIAEKVGWVSDTFSLTFSNLLVHAHGSEGEEARLSIPGKVFLIRPRRLGGASSIHEIRGSGSGRSEALRAAILWQINDVLLSKSLWSHHSLISYIRGLDRVELREFQSTGDDTFDD